MPKRPIRDSVKEGLLTQNHSDGSVTLPPGSYVSVPFDELNEPTQDAISEKLTMGEMETKAVALNWAGEGPGYGESIAMMTSDYYNTNSGYYGDALVPEDSWSIYTDSEPTGVAFNVKNGQKVKQYNDNENGDFGFTIGDNRYSVASGDELP